MCGITGFIDSTTTERKAVLSRMADLIKHRGPDSDGYYVDDSAALGFRRLSIIDLDHGHQPIANEDESKWITFNGEIYNFPLLREQLEEAGHTFRTDADTEVILHGFEEWGEDVVNHLRGMFAFVIWDRESRTLFGARDPFGIKPFYYQHNEKTFLYGSEIKSFLAHPHFHKAVNERALADYLSFEYIPGEETMFDGVKKLLAGHFFTFREGKLSIERYFTPEFDEDPTKSLDEWTETIQTCITESVDTHRISDVEVGCFLSSGIDSSYITNEFASKTSNVKAFSVGYSEEQFSELSYAREFANHIDVNFSAKVLGAEETFATVPDIQYFMDEPLPNPSALPLFFLTKHAAESVKVVMSGEGADELFGGYNQYREPLDYALYTRLVPVPVRRLLAKGAVHLPKVPGRRFLTRAAKPLSERFFRNQYVFSEAERLKVLKKGSLAATSAVPTAERTRALFRRCSHLDDITTMQYVDIHTWMMHDINLKADKMSMAHSLELRVPFLDRGVWAVARRLPTPLRVSKESTKTALRYAAEKRIPRATARKKKLGFPVPLNGWLREEEYATKVREAFNSEAAEKFFDRDYINGLLDRHLSGTDGYMKRIWSIYCFLVWHEEFFIKRTEVVA
ncbi:asparagine synthase (glutamine-hydrolyzing) [Dermabacter sp. Marseille-Q3180]|uniref:asparagine synthase (glutamine-hydrolyzing) n=1 Tax=Dermabacter sp. Marseille-Q3180 TaxID=2758090 RepID=UPI0020247A78|nr:asparagine synthase (glutamine-hydrolyzing) [Dermabacter sp. Marseille-Q3180]